MNRDMADAIDGLELHNEIEREYRKLFHLIEELPKSAKEASQAQTDYYTEKAQEGLRLKNVDKLPVTFINNILKGSGNVPKKMFEMDFTDKLWQANLENIYATKKYINHLEDEQKRVWGTYDKT